jgi:hypothetical protein
MVSEDLLARYKCKVTAGDRGAFAGLAESCASKRSFGASLIDNRTLQAG